MKIAAFSDVHGNKYAMSSFLAALQSVDYDRAVFLGDVLGYFYYPAEVLEMMRTIPALEMLRGNHDQMAYEVLSGTLDAQPLIAKYGSVYGQIDAQVAEQLSTLPFSRVMDIDGVRVGFFHGTPAAPVDGRLYPKDECPNPEAYSGFEVVICGHTHFRMDRMIGGARVLGAGSVGQPRDFHKPCFLLYDTVSRKAEYVEFDYDRESLSRDVDMRDPDCAKLKELIWRYE